MSEFWFKVVLVVVSSGAILAMFVSLYFLGEAIEKEKSGREREDRRLSGLIQEVKASLGQWDDTLAAMDTTLDSQAKELGEKHVAIAKELARKLDQFQQFAIRLIGEESQALQGQMVQQRDEILAILTAAVPTREPVSIGPEATISLNVGIGRGDDDSTTLLLRSMALQG